MIGADITDAVAIELDASDLAPEARDRLRPCLPVLREAIDNWQANSASPRPALWWRPQRQLPSL